MGGRHCTKTASPQKVWCRSPYLLHWLSQSPSVAPRCREVLWHTPKNSHSVAVDMLAAISASHLGTRYALAWETNHRHKWSLLMPGSCPTQASPASPAARRDSNHAAGGGMAVGLAPCPNSRTRSGMLPTNAPRYSRQETCCIYLI